ncbi:MAG: hypothetical protein LBH43_07265 [Treponema sp.]|jgi:hypothetical protein|nr:hypothetical protein [Treponema sp.]
MNDRADHIKRIRDEYESKRAAREKWLLEMEEEDREQLILIRKRAIEHGKLADVIMQTLSKYVYHLASKDPATLTHDEVAFLEKAGKNLKFR